MRMAYPLILCTQRSDWKNDLSKKSEYSHSPLLIKNHSYGRPEKHIGIRGRLHEIIYEADTPVGKIFDIILICIIILSIVSVILESIDQINQDFRHALYRLEWIFTGIFTLEYILRIVCITRPHKYIFSFYGIVDLLAVLPTYFSLVFSDIHYLIVIRAFRLLRIFRVFKLVRYTHEAHILWQALNESKQKIAIFLETVLILVVILGAGFLITFFIFVVKVFHPFIIK